MSIRSTRIAAEREFRQFCNDLQSGKTERTVEAMNCLCKFSNCLSRLYEQEGLSKTGTEDAFTQVDRQRPPRGYMRSGK